MLLHLPLLQTLVLGTAQVAWSLFALAALIGVVVLGAKAYWATRQQAYLTEPVEPTSTLERKYAPFQTQPHALSIRLLSTVVALALVLVVLAWTPLQQHLLTPLQAVIPASEAIIDVPITTQTPPQAPPPVSHREPQAIELVEVEPKPVPPEPAPDPVQPGEPTDPGPIGYKGGEIGEPNMPIYYEEPEPAPIEEEMPLLIADVMPRFPGCETIEGSDDAKKACADQQLTAFIYNNIRYPTQAREIEIEGTVVVSFIIDKKGQVKDMKLLRDPGAGLGKEAMRVMKLVQQYPERWSPGKQRGRPVAVRFNMPIKFKLNP